MNAKLHHPKDPLADFFDGSDPSPAPDAGGAERRRSPRFTPSKRVRIECREGVMSVFGWGPQRAPALLDLSAGGARVATQELLRPGTLVRLNFAAEGIEEGAEAFGEVRWSRPGSTGQFHSGVEFFKSREIGSLLGRLQRP